MKNLSKSFIRPLIALSLAAAFVLPAQAETTTPVEDFSVFVDLPTGFAFVKTPVGWRFVRQIEASKLAQLHPSTLVSVIQAGTPIGQAEAAVQRTGDTQVSGLLNSAALR